MPSYKLIYFDARGNVEPARLCFKQAEVEFEDVRVSREEWQNMKSGKYGSLFVLSRNVFFYIDDLLSNRLITHNSQPINRGM